jgi:hypothetical protein
MSYRSRSTSILRQLKRLALGDQVAGLRDTQLPVIGAK